MQRLELIAQEKANAGATPGIGAAGGAAVQIEKKENVTQAVKEAQQLETVFSLCRHGKYDELEKVSAADILVCWWMVAMVIRY
ncbi:hypothetical protein PINS_up008739 [Pythium insidiosum]|nr:hypothetical protein PINS_up008739 [Pythium insidiosum]